MTSTSGVVFIHSTPSALCPHIEWALGGVFGVPVNLDWQPQPAERGTYRAEYAWRGGAGSAACVASAFQKWGRLRFEVTEHPSQGNDGQRYAFTPGLGIFHCEMGVHGDVLLTEERVRHAMAHGDSGLSGRLDALLGTAWDAELDVFRHAGDGAAVRWLNAVG